MQENSGISNIGGVNKPKRRGIVIAAFFGALICVTMIVGTYYLVTKHQQSVKRSKVQSALLKTNANFAKQNYSGSEKDLSDALQYVTTDEQRYELLSSIGFSQYLQKKYDLSLTSLLAAEKIKGVQTGSAQLDKIAMLYAKKGDKKTAAEYWRKAIQRVKDTPDKGDDLSITQFESYIRWAGEKP